MDCLLPFIQYPLGEINEKAMSIKRNMILPLLKELYSKIPKNKTASLVVILFDHPVYIDNQYMESNLLRPQRFHHQNLLLN